jgi:fatty-acyl-CoA synthase
VVDEAMEDVPADGQMMGEVVMRGDNVMKGYYRDAEATAHAFRGGWFHSGDLGVMHPDGYIELRDRAKDIIISGGENISTIEVEQVILQHPAVLECAVVAVPDPKWGETPKAFVTLRAGAITGSWHASAPSRASPHPAWPSISRVCSKSGHATAACRTAHDVPSCPPRSRGRTLR